MSPHLHQPPQTAFQRWTCASLLSFPVLEKDQDFTCVSFCGSDIFTSIIEMYEEVIHWRHSSFIVPSANVGNSFVYELFQLTGLCGWLQHGNVCMKAVIILQALILPKESRTSKTKDHIKHLKGWMDLWKKATTMRSYSWDIYSETSTQAW